MQKSCSVNSSCLSGSSRQIFAGNYLPTTYGEASLLAFRAKSDRFFRPGQIALHKSSLVRSVVAHIRRRVINRVDPFRQLLVLALPDSHPGKGNISETASILPLARAVQPAPKYHARVSNRRLSPPRTRQTAFWVPAARSSFDQVRPEKSGGACDNTVPGNFLLCSGRGRNASGQFFLMFFREEFLSSILSQSQPLCLAARRGIPVEFFNAHLELMIKIMAQDRENPQGVSALLKERNIRLQIFSPQNGFPRFFRRSSTLSTETDARKTWRGIPPVFPSKAFPLLLFPPSV